MPRPPDLEIALVGSDDGVMKVIAVARDLVEDRFFIAENYGTYARKAGRHGIDGRAHLRRVQLVMTPRLGAGTHEAHLAQEDIGELGKLVDLGLAQEIAHGQNTRIVFLREDAARQVGTVFEHGGELKNVEVAAAKADAGLQVEDIVLA